MVQSALVPTRRLYYPHFSLPTTLRPTTPFFLSRQIFSDLLTQTLRGEREKERESAVFVCDFVLLFCYG